MPKYGYNKRNSYVNKYDGRIANSKPNKGTYNYGSEAPDYSFPEYDYRRQYNRDIERIKNVDIDKQQRKLAIKANRAIEIDNAKRALKLLVVVAVLCLGVFAIAVTTASVMEQENRNSVLRNDLLTLQDQNTVLAAEISDEINLEFIEQKAINELGMNRPQDYQIRTIAVPVQSYSVKYSCENESGLDIDFDMIKSFLTNN